MNGCPPRGWASILQKRSVARTDRFQNQMVVTGDSFPGVRLLSAESARVIGCTALPRLYDPLSGFLTVSAVFSHPSLVALFHATSAPRILVSRAFPSSPAVISLDIQCSLAVSPAPWNDRLPGAPVCPCPPSPALSIISGEQCRVPVAHLRSASDIILAGHPTCVEWSGSASGPSSPEG
jgi:hypothetical protein